ncbi:hypothetical protein [Gehongia tenuis]|nr:hypothetical protein [Gehongia tenuis]
MTDLKNKRTERGVHSPETAEWFSNGKELPFEGSKETAEVGK